MLTVVCFKWKRYKHKSVRIEYTAEHVNKLASMLERHLHLPYELVCVTDDLTGIDSSIRIVPLWPDLHELGRCYRRLKTFAPEMRELFGPRFVCIDLDCVILDDITPLFQRSEDFVICGVAARRNAYNGSMWMMTAGAREQVWTEFNPMRCERADLIGSDQAWIELCLGRDEAVWTRKDGVMRFSIIGARHERKRNFEPPDARIVFFPGPIDPSQVQLQSRAPWIKEHYG